MGISLHRRRGIPSSREIEPRRPKVSSAVFRTDSRPRQPMQRKPRLREARWYPGGAQSRAGSQHFVGPRPSNPSRRGVPEEGVALSLSGRGSRHCRPRANAKYIRQHGDFSHLCARPGTNASKVLRSGDLQRLQNVRASRASYSTYPPSFPLDVRKLKERRSALRLLGNVVLDQQG